MRVRLGRAAPRAPGYRRVELPLRTLVAQAETTTKRSKLLPRSIPVPDGLIDAEIERLNEAVAFAKSYGRMKRDSDLEQDH